MRKLVAALLITVPIAWLAPANAQLFNRKPKTPPAQRVPELIVQAKADPDERKRAAAAEELREFDTKTYPEIVQVLADVARTDPKTGVRYEAISSLAKLRPVSQLGGQTLEWAAVHDVALKVRWEAKSSLMSYRWAGYHSAKNDPKTGNTAPGPVPGEPPLYDPRLADPKIERPSTPTGTPSRTTQVKSKGQQPGGPASSAQTPPPLIVDIPGTAAETAPKLVAPPLPTVPLVVESSPKVGTPAVPPVPTLIEAAPKLGAPAVPTSEPKSGSSEPNFRPAGQAPPRPGFSTALPHTQNVAPPAPPTKNDQTGPALRPPM
jgi:HEAT repeats